MTLTPDQALKSYSPELVEALENAFAAVWTTLYAHVPVEGDDAKELKIVLSRTLVSLAAGGVSEPQELRRRALETIALNA
jgi:hypothetical protein